MLINFLTKIDNDIPELKKEIIKESKKIKMKPLEFYTEAHRKFSGANVKELMLKNSIKYLKGNNNFSNNVIIDLATGVINDLWKWYNSGIKHVIGIDNSISQYNEAMKRYSEFQFKDKIKVDYFVGSMEDPIFMNKVFNEKVNLITCNYALNHVNSMSDFLDIVSNRLNEGGLFIGTATDGDSLNNLFRLFGDNINSFMYQASKKSDKRYSFKINTPFFEEGQIEENFVFKQEFIDLAVSKGLIPFSTTPGVNGIFNLTKMPLFQDKIDRPVDIASLYFGFSFIKANKFIIEKYFINKKINQEIKEIKEKNNGLIIIPYRNRKEHLDKLKESLEYFHNHGLDTVIVEQSEGYPFNRGLLLNIGVKSFPDKEYYILHDVDLVPDKELIKYYFEFPINPIHIGFRGQRYSKDKVRPFTIDLVNFLGGVLSISKEDYLRTNGMSNRFWGWGGEDNVQINRLSELGLAYVFPEKGEVYDLEELKTFEEKKKLIETTKINKYLKKYLIKTDNKIIDGLSKVLPSEVIIKDSFFWIYVNVNIPLYFNMFSEFATIKQEEESKFEFFSKEKYENGPEKQNKEIVIIEKYKKGILVRGKDTYLIKNKIPQGLMKWNPVLKGYIASESKIDEIIKLLNDNGIRFSKRI